MVISVLRERIARSFVSASSFPACVMKSMRLRAKHRIALSRHHAYGLLAGLAVGAGSILPVVWWCVLAGMLLAFRLLLAPPSRIRPVLFLGLYIGFFSSAGATIWFFSAIPMVLIDIESTALQVLGVAATWAYIAAGQTLPVVLGFMVLWRYRDIPYFPLFSGMVWVPVEIGRMWMFTLLTFGPGALSGAHFSTASLGYALTENQFLLQFAGPFGLHGLNFMAAAIPAYLACWPRLYTRSARRPMQLQALLLLAALLVPVISRRPFADESQPRLRVAILAEQMDLINDVDGGTAMTQLLAQAGMAVPPVDVILLPETLSLSTMFWHEAEAAEFFREQFGNREVLFLNTRHPIYLGDSDPDAPPEGRERLIFESTTRGVIASLEKQILVPIGEYAPSFARMFYAFLRSDAMLAYLDDMGSLEKPAGKPAAIPFNGVRIGALLCSDALSPSLYRHLSRKERADVLVNLANHHWFHHSRLLFRKTLQMSRVHAVHNRRPFLVANNFAPAYALDHEGRVIAISEWGTRDVLYVNLPLHPSGQIANHTLP